MIFIIVGEVVLLIFAIVNNAPLWGIAGAILIHASLTLYEITTNKKFRLSVLDGISKFIESLE
jgi:hypothetical protein